MSYVRRRYIKTIISSAPISPANRINYHGWPAQYHDLYISLVGCKTKQSWSQTNQNYFFCFTKTYKPSPVLLWFFLKQRQQQKPFSPLVVRGLYSSILHTPACVAACGIPTIWQITFYTAWSTPLFKQYKREGRNDRVYPPTKRRSFHILLWFIKNR